jgi:hypothetical protein
MFPVFFPLNIRDQASQENNTADKITDFCNLIFVSTQQTGGK